jgi:hypothetical protein
MSMTADHAFEDPRGHAMQIRLDASGRTPDYGSKDTRYARIRDWDRYSLKV